MGKRGRPINHSKCKTCKIRRVRCDGARPNCHRCESTGRKCDGYTIPDTLPLGLCRDQEELRSFSYFTTQTSNELYGYYDEAFWQHHVPQLSYSYPALRHLVIAIGAMHEEARASWVHWGPAEPHGEKSAFALRQCNKAISNLVQAGHSKPSVVVNLTSSILLMAFSMLQNNLDFVLKLVDSAARMLDDWKAVSHTEGTQSERELIERTLMPIICRFVASTGHTQPLLHHHSFDVKDLDFAERCGKESSALATSIFNLTHAGDTLQSLVDGIFSGVSRIDSLDDTRRQSYFNTRLESLGSWYRRFQEFLGSLSKNVTAAHQRRISLLEIQYQVANALFPVFVYNDEMLYDQHLDSFGAIVQACQRILQIEAMQTPFQTSRMFFSFDLGIISPLYFVVSKCRDATVRRKALHLLQRAQRREGMWLSSVTGFVAEQVMAIEEAGLQNPRHCSDIPGERRIALREMQFDPQQWPASETDPWFQPVITLRWVSADMAQRAVKGLQEKTVQLPLTRDERPGRKSYTVVLPDNLDFRHWKLLIGRKEVDAQDIHDLTTPFPFHDTLHSGDAMWE